MNNAFSYLVDVSISVLLFVLIARFFLDWFRADYYDPMTQAIVRITDPLLKPFKFLPRIAGSDIGIILLGFLLSMIKIGFIGKFQLALPSWMLIALADFIDAVLSFLFWVLIARVVLSWVNPSAQQAGVKLLYQITEPMMARVRRLLPNMGAWIYPQLFYLLEFK